MPALSVLDATRIVSPGHGSAGGAAEPWSAMVSILVIAAMGAAYGRGVQELWCRNGAGSVVRRRNAVAFAAGIVTVAIAQFPQVRALGESSFAGHMVQHMLLLVIAGPLLAIGGAGLPLTLALPLRSRRRIARIRAGAMGRWFRLPSHRALVAGAVHTVVLWLWHLPGPYVAALQSPVMHAVEHVSFLFAAWLLWSAVLSPDRHRLPGPVGFALLFAAGMAAAALGAALTLAPSPLYPPAALAPTDPLADQQLAGLVMWIPMDVLILGLALAVLRQWLLRLEIGNPGNRELLPPDASAGPIGSGRQKSREVKAR